MADVQPENGFTRIANELLDELCKLKLNGSQWSIILAVWRCTYGWNKKCHRISLSFLEKKTGMAKSQTKRELDSLIKMGIIKEYKEATFNEPREIGFNKNYSEYSILNRVQSSNNSSAQYTNQSTAQYTNQSTKKDILKDILKDNYSELDELVSYYEKEVKKKVSDNQRNKLNEFLLNGKSKQQVLDAIDKTAQDAEKPCWKYFENTMLYYTDSKPKKGSEVKTFDKSKGGGIPGMKPPKKLSPERIKELREG